MSVGETISPRKTVPLITYYDIILVFYIFWRETLAILGVFLSRNKTLNDSRNRPILQKPCFAYFKQRLKKQLIQSLSEINHIGEE